MPKSGLRSKLILTAIAIAIVPLLLLLSELGVRIFARKLDPLAVFVASPQLRSDTQGATTAGMFEFDPLLTWRLKANLRGVWWDFTPVNTNAAHLRMDREVAAKGGVRVICLGDSVTFGYRVPVAAEKDRPKDFDATEKPWPLLLEEMLRAKYPGREIEVLPLACPGYTSRQGLEWLRRDIASLQPDFVLACFGWNDARAAGLPDSQTMPSPGPQVTVRSIMAHSQLMLHLAQNARDKVQDAQPQTLLPRNSSEEYVANFGAMASICHSHSAWFGIVLPVYRDPNTPGNYPEMQNHPGDVEEGKRITLYRNALQTHAEVNKIPFIGIRELTETGWPTNEDLFGERIHPNAAGHQLMAERIAAFLEPHVSAKLSP